jgi:hypothetical protein
LEGLVGPTLAVDPPLSDRVVGRIDAVRLGPLQQRIKDEVVDRVDDRVLVALAPGQPSEELAMDVEQVGV